MESVQEELSDLEHQDRREQEAEARAFRMFTRNKVSEEVYEKEVGLITTRRRWISEQRERLTVQLQQLKRHTFTPEDIDALLCRVRSRLAGASPSDRRFVLEAVGTSVFSRGDGSWEVELEIPKTASEELQVVSNQPESNYT